MLVRLKTLPPAPPLPPVKVPALLIVAWPVPAAPVSLPFQPPPPPLPLPFVIRPGEVPRTAVPLWPLCDAAVPPVPPADRPAPPAPPPAPPPPPPPNSGVPDPPLLPV